MKTDKIMAEANKSATLAYGNRLSLLINPQKLEYAVMIAIFNGSKRDIIRYEVSMKWKDKDNIHRKVEIDRISPVFVNDSEPDYVADELALYVSSTLYPLELLIDSNGAYSGINNYTEISERWSNKKDKIREYYKGEYLEKYLNLNDRVFRNKENIEQSLNNDLLLHAFFNSIHCAYGNNFQNSRVDAVPFFTKTKGIDYKITCTLHEYMNEQGYITVTMDGKLVDNRSKTDLEHTVIFPTYGDSEKATGTYIGKYMLESKYHTIDALMFDCSLDLEKKKKISVVVSRIRKEEDDDNNLESDIVPKKKENLFLRFNNWLNK